MLHDNNVFSTPDPVSDVPTFVRPSVEGLLSSPKLTIRSLAQFDIQQYARGTVPTTMGARRHVKLDGRWRSTSAFELGLGVRYDKSENPTDFRITASVLLPRQRAQSVQVTPSVAYRPTSRTTISGSYDRTRETLANFRSRLQDIQGTVAHQITPRTTWSMQILERAFGDDTSIQRRSHIGLFGWSYLVAVGSTLSVQVGPRFRSPGGIAPEILAGFKRRTPRTQWQASYWRGETMVLGLLGPVELHRASGTMTRNLSRSLDVGGYLGLFDTTARNAIEARVGSASVNTTWKRPPYVVEASYGVDLQRGQFGPLKEEIPVRRNVFTLRVTIAGRLSRVFRQPDDDDNTADDAGRPATPRREVIQ
jgi:hypothetical protein